MGSKLKIWAAVNVVGWLLAVPILVIALASPWVVFKGWPATDLPDTDNRAVAIGQRGGDDVASERANARRRPARPVRTPAPAAQPTPFVVAVATPDATRAGSRDVSARRRAVRRQSSDHQRRPAERTPAAPAPTPAPVVPAAPPAAPAPTQLADNGPPYGRGVGRGRAASNDGPSVRDVGGKQRGKGLGLGRGNGNGNGGEGGEKPGRGNGRDRGAAPSGGAPQPAGGESRGGESRGRGNGKGHRAEKHGGGEAPQPAAPPPSAATPEPAADERERGRGRSGKHRGEAGSPQGGESRGRGRGRR